MSETRTETFFFATPAAHVLFAALTALLCAGPLFHPQQPPVGLPIADPAQTQWNLWWIDQVLRGAVRDGDGFFQTSALFHPVGADLSFHTIEYSYGILLWPVRALFGGFAQHAAALLLATYLTAWWSWIATRAAGGNAIAAAAATVAITSHSYRLNEAHHLNIFSTQFVPLTLYLLLVLRWGSAEGAGRWSVRDWARPRPACC